MAVIKSKVGVGYDGGHAIIDANNGTHPHSLCKRREEHMHTPATPTPMTWSDIGVITGKRSGVMS